jgi:CheY-like chemotaxis protein
MQAETIFDPTRAAPAYAGFPDRACVPYDSMTEARTAEPVPAAFRAGGKVLIIDDDETMRALIKLHLVNAGYEVLEAADAVEGGNLVLGTSPRLVICDVEMPYLSGYEFATALKSDPLTCHIPVVFLTADDDIADKALQAGAVCHLKKPISADRLVNVVGRFIS